MKRKNNYEGFQPSHNHDRFLMFVCFLVGAVVGYFLTNHVWLLGA